MIDTCNPIPRIMHYYKILQPTTPDKTSIISHSNQEYLRNVYTQLVADITSFVKNVT